jgi:GTP-binding protein HflX
VMSDVLELEGGVRVPRVFVSALQGTGLLELRRILSAAITGNLHSDLNLAETASSLASPEDPTEFIDSAHRRQL